MKSDNKFLKFLLNIYNLILDIIYPKKCIFCNRSLNIGKKICICKKCRSLLDTQQKIVRDNYRYFEEAVCATRYDSYVREAMTMYKFNGKKYYAPTFAMAIYNKVKDRDFLKDISLICPVPIHPLRDRAYNQSEVVALHISHLVSIPVCGDLLIKIKNLKPLSTMNYASRRSLIKSAFAFNVKYNISGKTICLVDDIYTTGSTVNECSRILKMYGAKKVYVLSACYADSHDEGGAENADTDITDK